MTGGSPTFPTLPPPPSRSHTPPLPLLARMFTPLVRLAIFAPLPDASRMILSTNLQFLSDDRYDFAFFVDADVEWSPAMVERFIGSGHQLVAAMYPKKQLNWCVPPLDLGASGSQGPPATFTPPCPPPAPSPLPPVPPLSCPSPLGLPYLPLPPS